MTQSRLSFFLVNEIIEKLNVSESLAQRLEHRIKKAYRQGFDNYHYIASDVVDDLNSVHCGCSIEKEIGYDPDLIPLFKEKLSTIIHSWKNYSGDPDIKLERNVLEMTQQQFADALNVSKRTVEKWEQGERSPSAQIYKHIRVMIWFKHRNQLHDYLSI